MTSEPFGGSRAAGHTGPGVREVVERCVGHIHRIVDEIGPRPSASAEEHAAQQRVASLLEPFVDAVGLEAFEVSPRAFMGFVPISGALLCVGVALLPVSAVGSLACVLLSLGLLIGQVVLYKPLLDPLFPKATSHNVVATIRPSGPVERVLVLGGHTDSAWEWRWHYRGQWALRIIAGGAVLGALVGVAAGAAALLAPDAAATSGLAWSFAAFLPIFVLVMGFTDFTRVSPGANDNLTGVLMSVGLAELLRARGPLRGTEVRILATGSEECGVRGARAFVREHGEELTRQPSLYVALDTFRDLEHMGVYDGDRSGTLRHDPKAAALLQEAGRRAGLELPRRTIPVGGSDAIAFTEAGLSAIAFIAMDPAPPRWYHTRLDRPELLEPDCIEAGLRVLLELVELLDSGAR